MTKKCKKDITCKTAFKADCSMKVMESQMTSFQASLGLLITKAECAKMIDTRMAKQPQRTSPRETTNVPMPAMSRTLPLEEYIANSTVSQEIKDFMSGFVDALAQARNRNERPGNGQQRPR